MQHSCGLHVHAKQVDPTRTLTIRRRFESEIVRRFKRLRNLILEAIIQDEAFGPKNKPIRREPMTQAVRREAFNFPRSDQKVESFMAWLRMQQTAGNIDIVHREGRAISGSPRWANIYIDSAYQRGIRHARANLRKQGIQTVPEDFPDYQMGAGFNNPFHADRVGLVYTRTYSDLNGITDEMDKQISRQLAFGIAEGRNPLYIAQQIADRIDKIGITRARILARTETIRAHHTANIQEYRNAGIEQVEVVAEWVTAGDGRVCPICSALSGKIFTIDAIENMIPRHPQCRCVATPVLREDVDGRKIRKRAA